MEEIKTLIEKYKAENAEIIKKRPDLQFNNDFSLDGCKLDSNVAFIKELSGLAKRLNENGGLHKHIVSGSLPLTKEWIDANNSSKTGLIKCRECNDFALCYKDNYCCNCGKKLVWQ